MRPTGWIAVGVLAWALLGCGASRVPQGATCDVCARADVCCAAHTANPDSNCELQATCLAKAGPDRVAVIDGCAHYLEVASTPPAPDACGPHPDAE